MCNCLHTMEVPSAVEFQSIVERFYESNGLLAYLQCITPSFLDMPEVGCFPEFDSDGDGAFRRTKLLAEFNDSTNRLDALLQMYLVHACRGEMRHFLENSVNLDGRKKLLSIWKDRAMCAIHEPSEALRWSRVVYHAFNDFAWNSAFGGKAWANIAEALMSRLEGRVGLPDGQKPSSTFCYKPAIFIDYVLDLEHNTGSCLNKGWLNVGQSSLKKFQTLKTKGSVLDWGSHFRYEIEMIKARLPIKKANEEEVVVSVPSSKKIVMTPYGSKYIIEVIESSKFWEVSSYKEDDTAKFSAKAMSKDVAYLVQTKMAEALANGTTAGKRCFASLICSTCGYYINSDYTCNCESKSKAGKFEFKNSDYEYNYPVAAPVKAPAPILTFFKSTPKPVKNLYIDLSKFNGFVLAPWNSNKCHKFKAVGDLCVHFDTTNNCIWVTPGGNPNKVLVSAYVNNLQSIVDKLCVAIKQMGLKAGSIGNYYLKYGDITLSTSSNAPTQLPYEAPKLGEKFGSTYPLGEKKAELLEKLQNQILASNKKNEDKYIPLAKKVGFEKFGAMTVYYDSNGNVSEKFINLDMIVINKIFSMTISNDLTVKDCGGTSVYIVLSGNNTFIISDNKKVFLNGKFGQVIANAIQQGILFGDITKYKYYFKGKCVSK